jgi:hypothetical protein
MIQSFQSILQITRGRLKLAQKNNEPLYKEDQMKKIILSLLLTSGLSAPFAQADMPATHGMLLFGDQISYASHLPMFHKPHDYQLILQIKLKSWTRFDVVGAYEKQKASSESLFTLVPEKMDLTLLLSGQKKSFRADLFAGHFEKGGSSLGSVEVIIEKIIFSKKLNPLEPEITPEYVIFGEGSEVYAAHIIKGKPSVDEILKLHSPFTINDVEEVIYSEDEDLIH